MAPLTTSNFEIQGLSEFLSYLCELSLLLLHSVLLIYPKDPFQYIITQKLHLSMRAPVQAKMAGI